MGSERLPGIPDYVDAGWSKGRGWLADFIARNDRIQDETGAWHISPWSHTFWAFRWENGLELLYESLVGRGIRMMPVFRLRTSPEVESYARVTMPMEKDARADLWQACYGLIGRAYDWQHVLRLYVYINLWGRGSFRHPWWLRLGTNDRYHCAEFVEVTGRMAGLDLNYGHEHTWSTPATVTPHSLWRALRSVPLVDIGRDVQPAGSI